MLAVDPREVTARLGCCSRLGLWCTLQRLKRTRAAASADLFSTLNAFRQLRRAAASFEGKDSVDRQLTLLETLEVNVEAIQESLDAVAASVAARGGGGGGNPPPPPRRPGPPPPSGGPEGGGGPGPMPAVRDVTVSTASVGDSKSGPLLSQRTLSVEDGPAPLKSTLALFGGPVAGGRGHAPAPSGGGGRGRRSSVAVALRRARSNLFEGLTGAGDAEGGGSAEADVALPTAPPSSAGTGDEGGGDSTPASPSRFRRLTRAALSSTSAATIMTGGGGAGSVGGASPRRRDAPAAPPRRTSAPAPAEDPSMARLLALVGALSRDMAGLSSSVEGGLAAVRRRLDSLEADVADLRNAGRTQEA